MRALGIIVLLLSSLLLSLPITQDEQTLLLDVAVYGGRCADEDHLNALLKALSAAELRVGGLRLKLRVRVIYDSDLELEPLGLLYDVIVFPDGDLQEYLTTLTPRIERLRGILGLGGLVFLGASAYAAAHAAAYIETGELKFYGWNLAPHVTALMVTYEGEVNVTGAELARTVLNFTGPASFVQHGPAFAVEAPARPLFILSAGANVTGNLILALGLPVGVLDYVNGSRVILLGFYPESDPKLLTLLIAYASGLLPPDHDLISARLASARDLMGRLRDRLKDPKRVERELTRAESLLENGELKLAAVHVQRALAELRPALHREMMHRVEERILRHLILSLAAITLATILAILVLIGKHRHRLRARKGL